MFSCIISLFIMIVINNFIYVFFVFFLLPIFLALTLVTKLVESYMFFYCFFFFILFDLIKKLKILGKNKCKSFKSFRFVTAMIFYYFLNLDLMCGSVDQLTSSKAMLISFLYVGTWLYTTLALTFTIFATSSLQSSNQVVSWFILALIKSFRSLSKVLIIINFVGIVAKSDCFRID